MRPLYLSLVLLGLVGCGRSISPLSHLAVQRMQSTPPVSLQAFDPVPLAASIRWAEIVRNDLRLEETPPAGATAILTVSLDRFADSARPVPRDLSFAFDVDAATHGFVETRYMIESPPHVGPRLSDTAAASPEGIHAQIHCLDRVCKSLNVNLHSGSSPTGSVQLARERRTHQGITIEANCGPGPSNTTVDLADRLLSIIDATPSRSRPCSRRTRASAEGRGTRHEGAYVDIFSVNSEPRFIQIVADLNILSRSAREGHRVPEENVPFHLTVQGQVGRNVSLTLDLGRTFWNYVDVSVNPPRTIQVAGRSESLWSGGMTADIEVTSSPSDRGPVIRIGGIHRSGQADSVLESGVSRISAGAL